MLRGGSKEVYKIRKNNIPKFVNFTFSGNSSISPQLDSNRVSHNFEEITNRVPENVSGSNTKNPLPERAF
jgi:hypothetical protein